MDLQELPNVPEKLPYFIKYTNIVVQVGIANVVKKPSRFEGTATALLADGFHVYICFGAVPLITWRSATLRPPTSKKRRPYRRYYSIYIDLSGQLTSLYRWWK